MLHSVNRITSRSPNNPPLLTRNAVTSDKVMMTTRMARQPGRTVPPDLMIENDRFEVLTHRSLVAYHTYLFSGWMKLKFRQITE